MICFNRLTTVFFLLCIFGDVAFADSEPTYTLVPLYPVSQHNAGNENNEAAKYVIVMKSPGTGKALPLMPALVSTNRLTAKRRAEIIVERLHRLYDGSGEWWMRARSMIGLGKVSVGDKQSEWVLMWKEHGPDSSGPAFIVTLDENLLHSWNCVPATALANFVGALDLAFHGQRPGTKGLVKDRLDDLRKGALRRAAEADLDVCNSNYQSAAANLVAAIRLAPDYLNAYEKLIDLEKTDRFSSNQDGAAILIFLRGKEQYQVTSRLESLKSAEAKRREGETAHAAALEELKSNGSQLTPTVTENFDKALKCYRDAMNDCPWCITFHLLVADVCSDACKFNYNKDECRGIANEALEKARAIHNATVSSEFLNGVAGGSTNGR